MVLGCGILSCVMDDELTKLGMVVGIDVQSCRRSFMRSNGTILRRMGRPSGGIFGFSEKRLQSDAGRGVFRLRFILSPSLTKHFSSNEACA